MAEETLVVETPAAPVVEIPAVETPEPPAAETPAVAAETPATPAEAKPPKQPWWDKRIGQVTREKHEAIRRAEQAEAALAAALAAGKPAEAVATDGSVTDTPAPAAPVKPTERLLTRPEIQAEAARIVAQQQFDAACNRVADAGNAAFPDFDATLATLGTLGGIPQPLLEVVADMPDGHKIIDHLGKNPEEAMRIFALSPVKQAAEAARLEISLNTPKPKPISNAPAPARTVGGAARVSNEIDESTKMSDYYRIRVKQLQERGRI